MAIENAATLNARFKYVCTPSTVDAALEYLSDTACVPDAVYYQAEAGDGLNFEDAVGGLGGRLTGATDGHEWIKVVGTMVAAGMPIESKSLLGSFTDYLTESDWYWLKRKLENAEKNLSLRPDIAWWVTLQMATRIARNRGDFVALEWVTAEHAHVLLVALGHPGETRSDDLLIWNRSQIIFRSGFGWDKIMSSAGADLDRNDIVRLPLLLFGVNNILSSRLIFFDLDPNSAKLQHKKKIEQYPSGQAPQSRLSS